MSKKQQTKAVSSIADQKLREFAAQLVEEKKFQIDDAEIKAQLVEDLYERLEERTNAVILASIPPEKVGELDRLLETDTREAVSDFCEANIPNLQEIMTQALGSFRLTYLGLNQ